MATANATTFTYDAPTLTRVHTHVIDTVGVASLQPTGSRQGSASRPSSTRRTSTTHALSFIATNSADDLAAAVTRPDLANVSSKIQRQMQTREWTPDLIDEAVTSGVNYPAVNKLGGANTPATRYVSPTTGQSVVVDNATGEIIQVGGPGFKYGP